MGINDSFTAPDADIDSFMARWELESREVYVARQDIVSALGIEPGQDVGDIGCGTGLFTELLAAATGPEGSVLAVDISERFVDHVGERTKAAGLDNVTASLSTSRSAELPTASLDLAYVCDVYHHFEYHEDMLRSIRRALRPGGRFVFVDFHRLEGVTREWLLGHVRADQEVFRAEVEAAGFVLEDEVEIPAFEDNYCLRFIAP